MLTDSQPGHIDQIKQTNAGVVYRLIDRYGPISRIELSRQAQLAPASITKIVREMLEAHLVQETEFQEPGSRGRPAVGLMLDTIAWHFLAARIHQGQLTLALRDLSSKLVLEDQVPLVVESCEPLLDRIILEIDSFFSRHQKKLERLTAIAITLPGIVDTRAGIVHRMPYYDITEMPLGPTLEQRTGLPIYIQHEIPAWTLAESLFGEAQQAKDVIQLVIDDNVGAGIITHGQLLHRGSSALVEIGHTQVDPWGNACYCGNHGCLETVASTTSLLALTRQRLQAMPGSTLHHKTLTIENLCDAALNGDSLARDVITGVGSHLGRILALMVNIFVPQKILIGSPLNRAADILYPAMLTAIRQQALPAYSQDILLGPTCFQDAGTMPAAALVKDAMYSGRLLVRLLQG